MTRRVSLDNDNYAHPPKPGSSNLPGIAVLPFVFPGDAIIQRYFADGFAAQIIGSLARVPDLLVISPSTSLRFREPKPDCRLVARKLGVRFILSGDILRQDQRLAFRYRLDDADAGEMVWGDRIETNIDDLFEIEHGVVSRVVNGIVPHIREAQVAGAMQKRPDSLTAYDLLLKALYEIEAMSETSHDRARCLLDQAVDIDPSFAMPYAWAGRLHSFRVGQGWSRDRELDAHEASRLATKAVELDPTNSLALATAAHALAYLHRQYDGALVLFARAIAACHNDALAWALSSGTLSYCGKGREARERAELAIRLSPFDRSSHQFFLYAGLACYVDGDYAMAETWSRRSLAENSAFTSSHKILAASLVAQGRISDAREIARDLHRLEPAYSASGHLRAPFKDDGQRALFLRHLRAAGAIAPARPAI